MHTLENKYIVFIIYFTENEKIINKIFKKNIYNESIKIKNGGELYYARE